MFGSDPSGHRFKAYPQIRVNDCTAKFEWALRHRDSIHALRGPSCHQAAGELLSHACFQFSKIKRLPDKIVSAEGESLDGPAVDGTGHHDRHIEPGLTPRGEHFETRSRF